MRAFSLVALVALIGCNRTPQPAGGGAAADAGPVKVKVATPKRQALAWVIEQPATVEAFEITPLVARIPGYVASVAQDPAKVGVALPGKQQPLIDIGSEVKDGQLLATLAEPELDKEFAEKVAAVERAKAEQTQAEKDVAVADAQIAAAKAMVKETDAGVARADADVTRWKAELEQVNTQIGEGTAGMQTRLVATKSLDAAKAAKAEAEAKVATAGVLVAERTARKSRAEADVATAAARVKSAEAERDRVDARRSYMKITAPFTGIVTDRRVNTHTYVGPASGPLFTVARIDLLRVFAEVPELSSGQAGPGAKAVVRVPSMVGREYPGTVTRTTRVVSTDSRTLRVEIDIENPDRALVPGTYAVVQISASTPDAMVVPGGCILAADETHYVYAVESGKAMKYRVQLGRSEGTTVQVFGRRKATATSGAWEPFTGTEQLVSGNLGALADGTPVAVE